MLELARVSRVCLGLRTQTLVSCSPRVRALGAQVSRVAWVFTRARACIYRNLLCCFFFMREPKTLVTLDTLDNCLKVIVLLFLQKYFSKILRKVCGSSAEAPRKQK